MVYTGEDQQQLTNCPGFWAQPTPRPGRNRVTGPWLQQTPAADHGITQEPAEGAVPWGPRQLCQTRKPRERGPGHLHSKASPAMHSHHSHQPSPSCLPLHSLPRIRPQRPQQMSPLLNPWLKHCPSWAPEALFVRQLWFCDLRNKKHIFIWSGPLSRHRVPKNPWNFRSEESLQSVFYYVKEEALGPHLRLGADACCLPSDGRLELSVPPLPPGPLPAAPWGGERGGRLNQSPLVNDWINRAQVMTPLEKTRGTAFGEPPGWCGDSGFLEGPEARGFPTHLARHLHLAFLSCLLLQ